VGALVGGVRGTGLGRGGVDGFAGNAGVRLGSTSMFSAWMQVEPVQTTWVCAAPGKREDSADSEGGEGGHAKGGAITTVQCIGEDSDISQAKA
jgi:hypothetical protein